MAFGDNPVEQIQKHVDNFLTFTKREIQLLYGEDSDSETEFKASEIPLIFQGTCIRYISSADISGYASNGMSGTVYFTYDINIDKSENEIISNLQLLGGDKYLQDNVDNVYYTNLWNDFDNIIYTSKIKAQLVDGVLYIPNDVNNNNTWWKRLEIYKNDFSYSNLCENSLIGINSIESNELTLCPWNVEFELHDSEYTWLQGKYVTVNTHGVGLPARENLGTHLATTQSPSFLITDYQNIVNNYVTYGGNTYNDNSTYITNNGDTINTYFGDNYGILVPVGAGGQANLDVNLNFDDLIGTLQPMIDGWNNIYNLTGSDNAIKVRTWDEIDYIDQGEFYITPIEQIPKIPSAPDIGDVSIDIGKPIQFIGYGVTEVLSLFDSIGVSSLLVFGLLFSIVISKLRGD